MRIVIFGIILCAFLLSSIVPAACASGVEPGSRAPSFDIPLLGGGGDMSSGDLFPTHGYIFLVFWESGCPHCVETLAACESFNLEYSGDEITVVGVNSNERDILKIRGLVEANGITFTQLWDRTGIVAERYGVPPATLTIFLVSGQGEVLSRKLDPQGDVKALMEEMLSEGGGERYDTILHEEGSPGDEMEPVDDEKFRFHGYGRTRFQAIDAQGSGAVGPYGEELEPGNDLLYRFELEMTRKFGRYVNAGALLRISNEGEEILEAGPEYLGSEWGSAFAEFEANRFSLRLGYFTMFMTPLTLMRWDWDDNPRIGGDAGCGCGAAAGVLLVESLEELDPELVLEGGFASYSGSSYEARLFYAIPRRAREVSHKEVRSTDAEPAGYSLEIFGFDGRWQRFDKRTGSFWRAGLHLLSTWEDRRSVDFLGLGYPVSDPWYDSHVLSLSIELPLVNSLAARGEWVVSNRAREHGYGEITGGEDFELKGGGGIAGVVFEKSRKLEFGIDYLRLESEFYSPFAAISYEPNREGIRLSTVIFPPGDFTAVSLFYKRLKEIDVPEPGAEKGSVSVFGASLDVNHASGFGGSAGWLDRGDWRSGNVAFHDQYRRALVLAARYRLNKNANFEIEYQRVRTKESSMTVDLESRANLFSVYFSSVF